MIIVTVPSLLKYPPKVQFIGRKGPLPDLPSLEAVRKDIEILAVIREHGLTSGTKVVNAITEEITIKSSIPFLYDAQLPNLFKFSLYADCIGTPPDIVEEVIWSLKMQSEKCDGFPEDKPLPLTDEKYLMLVNIWTKLTTYLLDTVNRPEEAIPYFQRWLEVNSKRNPSPTASWFPAQAVFVYGKYGEALVRTGNNDEGRKMLERCLEGSKMAMSQFNTTKFTLVRRRLRTPLLEYQAQILLVHGYFARALRHLGEETKALEHEVICVKFLRSNPEMIGKHMLLTLLMPDGKDDGPILHALGGLKWLIDPCKTFKTDHNRSKTCASCGARPLQKALSRCAKCQYTYYCSRECQKKEWPLHKPTCLSLASLLDKAKAAKNFDPKSSEKLSRWKVWCNACFLIDPLPHALGLYRDHNRRKTHILLTVIQYSPKISKDLRYKFTTTHCGVFKIKDVLKHMEKVLNWDRGEAKRECDALMDEFLKKDPPVYPVLSLLYGAGVPGWLSCNGVCEQRLRIPYNRDWRSMFNLGAPPAKLVIPGVKDQEDIF